MISALTQHCCRAAVVCALAFSTAAPAGDFHAGPLYDDFPLTLTPGERTEAVGPLFHWEVAPERKQWAIPPLFSHTWYPDVDGEEKDFLYPLLTYDRYGKESRWQFFQLLSFSGGQNQDGQMVERSQFIPFYYHQRSPIPEDNYTAVFPFYGTIKHQFMWDEVHFVLWPIYVKTRKKDVITDNYLVPFFDVRHGDGLRGWQLWPLVGTEHKAVTTRTNDFGLEETIPGHDKFFAVWPLFFHDRTGLGTTNPVDAHVFLPFYSLSRSPQRDVSTYLWPFFNYTDDREQKYREWDFPWPLWVIARGEGKTITRFIPLYSRGHTADMDSESYLWPLVMHRYQHSPEYVRERTRFAIWMYSNVKETKVTLGTTKRRVDGWPFFTYLREHDGNQRFQILAPLEPVVPENKSVERNLSPLWSLWRSERDAQTGATSQSLLWNLYRRDTTPDSRQVSLLLGLFQYRSNPEETRWRFFFIPITKHKQEKAAQ